MEQFETDFDGVFRFTNPTDEDFSFFWNSIEYPFKAGTTTPMLIRGETLENIQEIRKKAAYQLATREFYKGKEYLKMSKMGNGLPPLFDEKILEPMIEQCLKPLPVAKSISKKVERNEEKKYKSSKAVKDGENLAYIFKDDEGVPQGKMPDTMPTDLAL